ncbi:splicing factor 3B subunit 5/RDS3 complex subunit 10 [Kickxella alabastrina]|uniref:splicing factor 3B subunit 5/RDS3 complex subunit 10 n=1 Tax=Kickxella alabastrina TaxID=61397 RepID=UPI00221FF36A|nr:splicing factor 3B subunit 5/RDS3 complex subunit 10 [Kickxella alabastrina]KAI7822833.1 splicing factor 3B subunit 5/RDS3 complex subunit 10 [Kickxella alabastrina]
MDKFGMHSQTEQMHARHVGTGNADTTKHQWLTNQHRDTLTQYVTDNSLATYIAIAEGESLSRVKFNMLQRMREPCGPTPAAGSIRPNE